MDIARLRADTPGCEHTLHFNNAGASLSPRPVLDAVVQHLELEARIGGYHTAARAAERIAEVRARAARLLGAAGPHEIALMDSATRAYDAAILAFPWQPGERILMGHAAYGSNAFVMMQLERRFGVERVVLPDDASGTLDLEALEREAARGAALISLTHIPTSNGLVSPAEAVGRIARAHNIPFLLDACQSVGQRVVDVEAIGCDLLAATGRKFLRGPRGTGLLYVRASLLESLHPMTPDVRSARWITPDRYELAPDATRFELWERSDALLLGLGEALKYALDLGMDAIQARIESLAEALRAALTEVPGCRVLDRGLERSGIVTFVLESETPRKLQERLRAQCINISVGNLNSARLDLGPQGLDALVRASLHVYNTHAEIQRFIEALSP